KNSSLAGHGLVGAPTTGHESATPTGTHLLRLGQGKLPVAQTMPPFGAPPVPGFTVLASGGATHVPATATVPPGHGLGGGALASPLTPPPLMVPPSPRGTAMHTVTSVPAHPFAVPVLLPKPALSVGSPAN